MSNKKVSKAIVESFLLEARRFWHYDGSYDSYVAIAELLEKFTGIDWVYWKDLADSILAQDGFNKDATDEDFFGILKIIGLEVVDE